MLTYLFWTGQFPESLLCSSGPSRRSSSTCWTWNGFGIALMNSGRFEEADRAFARALEVDPSTERRSPTAGIALVLAGRPAEALAFCRHESRSLVCKAMAHHALGDARQSQRALDAMLADPR